MKHDCSIIETLKTVAEFISDLQHLEFRNK